MDCLQEQSVKCYRLLQGSSLSARGEELHRWNSYPFVLAIIKTEPKDLQEPAPTYKGKAFVLAGEWLTAAGKIRWQLFMCVCIDIDRYIDIFIYVYTYGWFYLFAK